jgi:anti-anti-sigma factor
MQIERIPHDELLELRLTGPLDNESSRHFQETIHETVREGWHRILVDLQGVHYLSSAGIGALLSAQKQLAQLKGFFGIANPTPDVMRVLSQVRLLDKLLCDPKRIRSERALGSQTLSMEARIAALEDLELEVYTFEGQNSLCCRRIGNPLLLDSSLFTEADCQEQRFSRDSLGIGLGALGEDYAHARSRFGEFLSVMGAVAQSGKDLPDYSFAQEEYVPPVQLLYGLSLTGTFSHLVRFSHAEPDKGAKLSAIVHQALTQSECQAAGLVLLAESAGLVGAKLNQSPAEAPAASGSRFDFPAVRDWLSFSPERIYPRHLALLVGVACLKDSEFAASELSAMLRPIDREASLFGHFHAAVFPYRPLKKRTLDLEATVQELFGSGTILDVLHLFRDDREPLGVGETELLGGACWTSPIREVRS